MHTSVLNVPGRLPYTRTWICDRVFPLNYIMKVYNNLIFLNFSENEEPADFEKAIVAAKWGKFHLMVYVIAITSGWSSMFETTTMSYVFPAAECDLDLKLEHKGLLNAVTYTGLFSFVWLVFYQIHVHKKLK